MKKIVAFLLACVLMSFALVSCNSSLEGTYVYDTIEVNFIDEKVDELVGALGDLAGAIGDITGIDLDEYKDSIAAEYVEAEIILEDGKIKMGTDGEYDVADYEQDGDDVKVVSEGRTVMTFQKQGGKLVLEYETEDIIEVKVFFKKK